MFNPDQQNIAVANRVARIMGVLAFGLCFLLFLLFGANINTPVIFAVGVFFFSIPLLNKRGATNVGRIGLCIVPVIVTISAALLAKLAEPGHSDILYYDSRFFLLLLTVIPCLIFNTSEYYLLYGCLIFNLATLLLFDPVHEFLGVGYYQRGFTGRSYYYINYAAVIAFAGIAAGSISLKRVVERTERQNLAFREDLLRKNKQLQELLSNIERKNEEILAQSEELQSSQEQLMRANAIIEEQKTDLQQEVKKVNSELLDANEELVKHNNELRQFSYTISHNLRGPIARLLGLTYIANIDKEVKDSAPAMAIIDRIKIAARELDHVVHDLNEIVDIRNEIYQVREKISFSEEWTVVCALLQISDEVVASSFSVNFSGASDIYSVKPMINSILFNLISNVLKYQSPDRQIHASIRTYRTDSFTTLEVADNGLGIDLLRFGKDMFGMYKRFHPHQEGKGLGLYLIKSQVEFLKGNVEVESQPDHGSVFRVYIPDSKP
jgi:signal transduction histidine kinase